MQLNALWMWFFGSGFKDELEDIDWTVRNWMRSDEFIDWSLEYIQMLLCTKKCS
jgi:hypothetical protein